VKKKLIVLRRRAEFMAVAEASKTKLGKKWVAQGLILQVSAPHTPETMPSQIRYGLTASGKVGNAVIRNRARRRLRALAFEVLPLHASPLHDYVLIARDATKTRDYEDLRGDLVTGLKRLGLWQE